MRRSLKSAMPSIQNCDNIAGGVHKIVIIICNVRYILDHLCAGYPSIPQHIVSDAEINHNKKKWEREMVLKLTCNELCFSSIANKSAKHIFSSSNYESGTEEGVNS